MPPRRSATLFHPLPAFLALHTLAAVLILLMCWAATAPVAAASPARSLASSTLPAGSNVQLTPTFPAHTGDVPTTSVGQPATFQVSIPDSSCGNPCWLDQGYPIDVYIVEVSHMGAPASCAQSAAALKVSRLFNGAAGVLAVSDGFTWPAAATSTAFGSPWYALCVHVEVPQSSSFYPKPDYATGAAPDEGSNAVYKVIWDRAPTVTVSPSSVAQGQTVTFTGHNWVPVYNDSSTPDPTTAVGASINQYVMSSHDTIRYASGWPQVSATGDFTISFHITASYPPGQYLACVGSERVLTYCDGGGTGVPFQIVAAPSGGGSSGGTGVANGAIGTPTPTAAATTGAVQSTPAVATPSGASASGTPSQSADWLRTNLGVSWESVIAILVTVLVLGAIVATAAVLLSRRRQKSQPHRANADLVHVGSGEDGMRPDRPPTQ